MTTYKSIKYNISGADITGLTAGQIPNLSTDKLTSGTLGTARLGSGTASGSNFLRGDNTWVTPTDTNTTYSVQDGQLSQINFTSADNSKLDGIASSANNYSHPTSAGNKHIPSGGSSGQFLKYSSSGTATWAADNNTTYSVGDGGLSQINFTSADNSKLDGIASSANNYSHPTSAGNKHIPSGGSSGQFLKYSSSGTATWAADNNTTYSVGDNALTQKNFTTTLKSKLDGIASSANNYSHPTSAGNKHIPSGGSANQVLTYSSSGTASWATPSGGANKPYFMSGGRTSNEQVLHYNYWYQITGWTETYDSDGCFSGDTFTPNSAGYYKIVGQLLARKNGGNVNWLQVQVRKNGSTIDGANGYNWGPEDKAQAYSECIVYANGSSDSFRVYALASGSTGNCTAEGWGSCGFFGYKLIT